MRIRGEQRIGQAFAWALLCSLFLCLPLRASATDLPAIAIVIDDLGDNLERGRRAIAIDGPLAYAFLPHSPHSKELAEMAHRRKKEVMLHLPMQPTTPHRLAPGTLRLEMTQNQLLQTLRSDLESVPHVIGVNNHMGSLLTRHPGHMAWLMKEIRRRNLFFIDSRTTASSVAALIAVEHQVPVLQRDIFLDHDRDYALVERQMRRLINTALATGLAVGIGHPYTETLDVLERWLPRLDKFGVKLIPVSVLVKRNEGSNPTWQASLSHSPQAAKSSKQ